MGALRGYSIIEIRDDYRGARVHVREMRFANLFSRAVLRDFEGRSFVDLEWTVPLDAAGRPEDPIQDKRVSLLRRAEDALRGRNDPAEALKLLSDLDVGSDEFGRRLLVEAAVALGNPSKLIEVLHEPLSIEELVLLVDACIVNGNSEMASDVLTKYASNLCMPDSVKSELKARVGLMKWSKS
jgi:hypothetical protein